MAEDISQHFPASLDSATQMMNVLLLIHDTGPGQCYFRERKSAYILRCALCLFISQQLLPWNASDPAAVMPDVFRLAPVSVHIVKRFGFFPPLLFFSHIFEPCTSLGINLNPTTGKKKKTPKPIKPNPHTKTLRESLQSQFWLLHTTSAGEQPKRQCTSPGSECAPGLLWCEGHGGHSP